MARATYGLIITDLHGSIGGATFQQNHAGAIVRARPVYKSNRVKSLSAAQLKFKLRCNDWNALTTANRNTWIAFAAAHSHFNYYNEEKTTSPFNWFVLINNNLESIGEAKIVAAPAYTLPEAVPDFTLDVNESEINLIADTPYTPSNAALYIFSTPKITSNFLKQRAKFLYTHQILSGEISEVNILSQWCSVHNDTIPAAGSAAKFNIVCMLIHIEQTTGLTSIGFQVLGSYSNASTWTPASLTDLRAWFKSDTGITKDGADLVSQWDDQSGEDNHLIQATGANQPLWEANQINSLPALYFDGIASFMKCVAFTLVRPETIFIVFNYSNVGSYSFDGNTVNTGVLIVVSANNIYLYNGAYSTTPVTELNIDTWGLLTNIFYDNPPATPNTIQQLNNETEHGGGGGSADMGGFTLGQDGGSLGYFSEMQVAEIVIMAAKATDDERSKMRNYIALRYGISM